MPEIRKDPSSDGLEALKQEVESAEALLGLLRDLEAALRAAVPGDELLRLVRLQEMAAHAVALAARQRRLWFDGPGSLEAWLEGRPSSEAALARTLGGRARELKDELGPLSRRCHFLAEKSLEWSQGQMEAVLRVVDRTAPTYPGPGQSSPTGAPPAWMDRTV
jgi:hypothetical protein